MKCLSVRQPWAWLLVSGLKDIENRTWKTKHRGELLVHASQNFDYAALDWLFMKKPRICMAVFNYFRIGFNKCNGRHSLGDKSKMGGIVGKVNLDGIVNNSSSSWAMSDCYHWQVSGAEELPFVPMKGRLGLFNVENK